MKKKKLNQIKNLRLNLHHIKNYPDPLLPRPRQTLIHKLLLRETQPPLARLPVLRCVNPIAHPHRAFLTQLRQILPQKLALGQRRRFRIHRVERKARFAGDVKSRYGKRVHFVQGLLLRRASLQAFQTFRDVQRKVD